MVIIFAGPIGSVLRPSATPLLLAFLLASIILFQVIAYGTRKWILKPKLSSSSDKLYLANLTAYNNGMTTLRKWMLFTFVALFIAVVTTIVMTYAER